MWSYGNKWITIRTLFLVKNLYVFHYIVVTVYNLNKNGCRYAPTQHIAALILLFSKIINYTSAVY